jgi:tRNA pseudouridine38-40 synthase
VTTRIRIDLAYDGTGFSGWARQPGLKSVEGALGQVLCRVLRIEPTTLSLVVAGRTDAGVHATGQVCHADIADTIALPEDEAGYKKLTRQLNGALGRFGQVVISRVQVAPEGFDARFSPLSRRYLYRIADRGAVRDPRLRHHTLWLDETLDDQSMNQLASRILGLHDWATFCRAREGATTIRDLQEFSWTRDDEGVLGGEVVADAFCHSMVRSLVGAAVAVGMGKCSIDDILQARDKRTRTSLWKTMAAHGLTLEQVVYPADSELAARQEATRATRSLASD